MKNPLRILHVEDSPKDTELVKAILEEAGIACDTLRVETRADYVSALEQSRFDLILGDYTMPGFDGLTALKIAREKRPDVPFIFVSGTLGEDIAIEALKYGAVDYVLKDRLSRLVPCVRRALRQVEEQKERKQAQEALQESEARKKAMLEGALDAIIAIDHLGKILEFNPAAETTFGYRLDQVIGKPVADVIIPPHLREKHRQGLRHYIATGEGPFVGKVVEITAMRADGTEFPAELAITPIGQKWPPLFLGHIRNITQRKQAQEEVQRNLERIRALHEIDVAIGSTLDLRTVLNILLEKVDLFLPHASISFIRLLNRQTGRLEPVACRNIDIEELKAQLERIGDDKRSFGRMAMETKTPITRRNMQTDPRSIHTDFYRNHGIISYLVVPLIAKDETLGVLGFYTKIEQEFSTEEIDFLETLAGQAAIAIHNAQLYEQAQKTLGHIRALREIDRAITSTLDLQAVLDVLLEKIDLLLPYSATSVRLWKAETGKLEPVACRNIDMQGWQTAGPRGVGLPRAVFEAKQPVVIQNVQTDPRSSAPHFLRSQGLVSYLGIPLIVKDEILGVLGFYTKEEHEFNSDEIELLTTLARQAAIAIHNSQMYQEMSNLAADLAKSNKVKEEFLSVMSHELRTPLNVVMGYTALLKERMLGDINPKQEDALAKITGRANDQLAMINNILYATVLEAQNLKLEHQPVVLGDLLKQIRSTCEAILDRPLALKWDCNDPLLVVHTDGGKLRQALQNLLDNAIKFMEKGDITVSARHDREQKLVEFKVSDTGIGIPKHFLPFIFDKFHQVDSSETRLYGGVGLGLYITRRFVEVLGGKVSADSEVGKGSTFMVTIPYRSDAGS